MNRLQFINYGPLGFCLTSLTSHNKSQKCHSTMSLNTKYSHTQCHTVTHLMNNHLNNPWLDLNMSTCPWFLDIMVDDVSFVNFVTEPISAGLDLLFVFVRILPKIYLLLLRSLRRHTGTLPKQKSLFYIVWSKNVFTVAGLRSTAVFFRNLRCEGIFRPLALREKKAACPTSEHFWGFFWEFGVYKRHFFPVPPASVSILLPSACPS